MALRTNKIHDTPRPENFQRWNDKIKNYLFNFCQETNLHGFQHIMNHRNSTIFTRLFFAISCFCSVSLCVYLIVLQLYDMNAKSVISSITSTAYPIWKIPFPAVTICNINVVQRDHMQKFKDIMEPFQINNGVVDDFLINLKSLINFEEVQNASKYDEIFQALNKSGYSLDNIMQMLTKPCNDMMESCSWQTHRISCTKIFKQIKTTHGYCCSFNYYGIEKYVKDFKNKKNNRFRYAKGGGSTFRLHVHLKSNATQYISALHNSIGFTVQVQDQFNYPNLDYIANTLERNMFLTISVTPTVYSSSEQLRSIPITSRNCMFADEGNLHWSSIYTFSNCINECLTKRIIQYCNCIPFYYPRNDSTKVCTLKDVECLRNNKFNYSSLINPKDYNKSPDSMNEDESTIMACKCYPQCNENMLDFHVDQSKKSNVIHPEMSILNVFYDDIGCIKAEREIYFTWDRLLASIGGIFGLCIGGSLISILEIVYFLVKNLIYYKKNNTKVNLTVESNKSPILYVQDFNHREHNNNNDNLKTKSKIQITFSGVNVQKKKMF